MDYETIVNGVAGLAALVNSLILWPIVRNLKHIGESHDKRITRLERKPRKSRGSRG